MFSKTTAATTLVAAFLFLVSPQIFAQANIRESAPIEDTPAASTTASVPQTPQVERVNYSYQIQLLQEEIMSLRGQIEEQAFEIKRLKQQRLDDYISIDKRITEVRGDIESLEESQKAMPVEAAPEIDLISPISPVLPLATSGDGKSLYDEAINALLDQQDYVGAKEKFTAYLSQYPEGRYTPNVHYWLGQIYLSEADQNAAEASFLNIVQNYPNHQKAADAQFKLARIYFDQGKTDESKAMLTELAQSDTDASQLAQSFLDNNF